MRQGAWGQRGNGPGLVVNLVAEAGRVDNGERDAGALLVELDCDGLDLDTLLDVGGGGIIRLLVLEDLVAAQRVDKGCAARARGTADHQAELDTLLDILLPTRLEHLRWLAEAALARVGRGGVLGVRRRTEDMSG